MENYSPSDPLGGNTKPLSEVTTPEAAPHQPQGIVPWLMSNGPYLLIGLALFIFVYVKFDVEGELALIKVVLGLGFVIFIHELGHFAVAKWCDVHVETFSIGFGPAWPGCSFRWGETTYMIALIPLGGYVKMVGEGSENEEDEEDPRSFKNKPVWQRMAIISAGVIMNVVLAIALFGFVYMTHGEKRVVGVIDHIEPGGPAWKEGVRTGDTIYWIDGKGPRPYFDDLKTAVINSSEGEKLRFVFGPPGANPEELPQHWIEPRKEEGSEQPMIGIGFPVELKLPRPRDRKDNPLPVVVGSPAAQAQPPFEFGDIIVGTTDPGNPKQVTRLPPDPRNPEQLDYFDYQRRLRLLAGKPMIVQVRRQASEHAEPTFVDLEVPAAFHYTLGLRMRMGKIAAVRDNSGAAKAGIQEKDVIDKVEVTDAKGDKVRWVPAPAGSAERFLDPVRLPFDLAQWAADLPAGADKKVTLQVVRQNPPPDQANPNHAMDKKESLVVSWEDGWDDNSEQSLSPATPLSISGLGIAYRVEPIVDSVQPDSPAVKARVRKGGELEFKAGDVIRRKNGDLEKAEEGKKIKLEEGDEIAIQKGDLLKTVRFQEPPAKEGDSPRPGDEIKLEPDRWAFVCDRLQLMASKEVLFRIERDKNDLEVSLTAQEDKQWPLDFRGVWLPFADRKLQKADTWDQALAMGVDRTVTFIRSIYGNLKNLAIGRVSYKQMAGPITIARYAFNIAGEDFYDFLTFLALISANLAVINFLPIPLLDGGHMVFLIYEKLRGKPASELVRATAAWVGIAFILSLMVLVTFLDVGRLWRGLF